MLDTPSCMTRVAANLVIRSSHIVMIKFYIQKSYLNPLVLLRTNYFK